MELQHFSHEHHLLLREEGDDDKEGNCSACSKPISGRPAYICKPCDFFLHKPCAEQLEEIKHPVDAHQHTLKLYPLSPYTSKPCICNVCREIWEYFTYHCSLCDIDVCICCALEERMIKHDGHDHPLALLQRPALFFCNACGTEEKDSSYVCATCEFWIHKSCASLPSTTRHASHDHPLILGYSLPDTFRKFGYLCQICDKEMHPPYWIYQCSDCRYVTHLKCATLATEETLRSRSAKSVNEDRHQSPISLPVNDDSIDLITTFVKQICSTAIENAIEVNHPSHEHPLFLSNMQDHKDTVTFFTYVVLHYQERCNIQATLNTRSSLEVL